MKTQNQNKLLQKIYKTSTKEEQSSIAVYQVKGALSQLSQMRKFLAARAA